MVHCLRFSSIVRIFFVFLIIFSFLLPLQGKPPAGHFHRVSDGPQQRNWRAATLERNWRPLPREEGECVRVSLSYLMSRSLETLPYEAFTLLLPITPQLSNTWRCRMSHPVL